jgi:diguanylate cyclase (GGDEF)-like protein
LKIKQSETVIAIKAMLGIVAIAFVAEAAIMGLLDALGVSQHTPAAIVLDAALLSLVIAPPIYWLVLTPVRREYEKRREAEVVAEDMGKLAITDALTRIMNRRGITVGLLDAMAQAERYNTPLSAAMVDIDHFKQVNDRYGHEAGDKVLAEVAGILADALRMPDKVGRYGGEEFLIVFPHTDLAQARKIAERIRATVGRTKFDIGPKKIPLTISMGVTQFTKGEDLEQLMSRADATLYEAKQGGRNLVVARKAR